MIFGKIALIFGRFGANFGKFGLIFGKIGMSGETVSRTTVASALGSEVGGYMTRSILGFEPIDEDIEECFQLIGVSAVENYYLRRFKDEKEDRTLQLNSFRELIIGAYFAAKGFAVSRQALLNKTPDWHIQKAEFRAVVEVSSKRTDHDRYDRMNAGELVHLDSNADARRVAEMIREKAAKYDAIARSQGLGLIICPILDFTIFAGGKAISATLPSVMSGLGNDSVICGCLVYENLRVVCGYPAQTHPQGQHRFNWTAHADYSVDLPTEDAAESPKGFMKV